MKNMHVLSECDPLCSSRIPQPLPLPFHISNKPPEFCGLPAPLHSRLLSVLSHKSLSIFPAYTHVNVNVHVYSRLLPCKCKYTYLKIRNKDIHTRDNLWCLSFWNWVTLLVVFSSVCISRKCFPSQSKIPHHMCTAFSLPASLWVDS